MNTNGSLIKFRLELNLIQNEFQVMMNFIW